MKVIIMRGLPGSGKSTFIKNTFHGIQSTPTTKYIVCSADDYHMVDGEYRFDVKKAQAAHQECFKRFGIYVREAVHGGLPLDFLIVDNTNISPYEIAPYQMMAAVNGLEAEIVYLPTDLKAAIKRNIHGVPATTILEMHRRLNTESLPPWWKMQVVFSWHDYCDLTINGIDPWKK